MKRDEEKIRLDQLLVLRGLAESRNKAQALIMAGKVFVNGSRCDKSGSKFPISVPIEIKEDTCPYVSRGGIKLEFALKEFEIDVKDKICLDVGASTGGFTHCLLNHGAKLVYAIDVGHGQLHHTLRKCERVKNFENINVRYLTKDTLGYFDSFDIITIDVSFISLRLVFPALIQFIGENTYTIALIKPQFEAGREYVQKGGLIKDPKVHQMVLENVCNYVYNSYKLRIIGVKPSPIKGTKGNQEFLMVTYGFEK